MKEHFTAPVLEPQGFNGFGIGHYAYCAAWPLDTLPGEGAVEALNRLGYFGPGAWGDAEGGLIAAGCLDAPT